MSIDFSKAPEGATHYRIMNACNGLMWYKADGNGISIMTDVNGWFPCGRTLAELTPIPAFEQFTSCEDAQTTGSGRDPVNNPSHYASGGVECIEAIKASMSHEAFMGYLKGNVQKYLWRYEKKVNPVEDLKKAQWYLARLTEAQEGE